MKRSTIREGGGKRLQAVVADGEKAKSKQRAGDAPLGSCKRNKGQVTYDVSIRTLALKERKHRTQQSLWQIHRDSHPHNIPKAMV